ncbi:hypothetical protein K402DRAFT_393197 [Aulographum hederae CBS 113979]|uniref:Uncharacterized protein n=1 Tax=Aulographum hederae CBS 113979 TaxID=1176131 RepID=A0A6G1H1J4_9PEZI|nr:hypothetical protein K402DRAFT_393197 [Aulographum hederae CBS 113979]
MFRTNEILSILPIIPEYPFPTLPNPNPTNPTYRHQPYCQVITNPRLPPPHQDKYRNNNPQRRLIQKGKRSDGLDHKPKGDSEMRVQLVGGLQLRVGVGCGSGKVQYMG